MTMIRILIFTATMLLTSEALAQSTERTAKRLADVDGTDYHAEVIEVPKGDWKCVAKKECAGVIMEITPARYSASWREMMTFAKFAGAKSDDIDKVVSYSVI